MEAPVPAPTVFFTTVRGSERPAAVEYGIVYVAPANPLPLIQRIRFCSASVLITAWVPPNCCSPVPEESPKTMYAPRFAAVGSGLNTIQGWLAAPPVLLITRRALGD